VLNIAQYVAAQPDLTVGFFSLEMSKESLFLRMLTSEAHIDSHRLMSGAIGQKDYGRIAHALETLSNMRLHIDDTAGIIPQSYVALSEAVGIPNNGGMHIVERIRLRDADTLAVELTIAAPEVLTETWTTTRLFVRRRGRQFDIVEGQCVQGELVEADDEHGNAIFEHAPLPADGRVPIGR